MYIYIHIIYINIYSNKNNTKNNTKNSIYVDPSPRPINSFAQHQKTKGHSARQAWKPPSNAPSHSPVRINHGFFSDGLTINCISSYVS